MRSRQLVELVVFLTCLLHKTTHCSYLNLRDSYYDPHMDDAILAAEAEMRAISETDKRAYDAGVDNMQANTVQHHSTLYSGASEIAAAIGKLASLQLKTLKLLMKSGIIKSQDLKTNKPFKRGWKKKFRNRCQYSKKYVQCDENAVYRTLDGTCNNLWYPTWGSAMAPQLRKLPPMYDDGVDTPRQTARDGSLLRSPRHISNVVFSSPHIQPRNSKLTMMVMQFGQFIDHDFISTPVSKGQMGSKIDCCRSEDANMYRDQCLTIKIPYNDPYFKQFKKTCMNFVRSLPATDEDCNPGYREQLNVITSYIDGSGVYGSSEEEATMLRAENGLLKTEGNDQLPRNPPDTCTLKFPAQDWCQKAGDKRSNVVPSLGWSHTTFMREHNRIAKILAALNPQWSGETVYQETRRIITALIQHITYNEYLPSFLSDRTMRWYNLWSKPRGYARHYYKPWVNPTLANVFAVAVFRHGHSQVPNYQAWTNLYYNSTVTTPIENTFMDPHWIQVNNGEGLNGVSRWLANDLTPLADRKFGSGIRDKLFETSPGASLDLPATNIQRGRDHGTPSYNYWRKYCGLGKVMTFENMPDHDEDSWKLLRKVYNHVDDIDLYPGAMTETHLPGSFLGPTFTCLMAEQFRDLKEGDRFWYETPKKGIRFTRGQLNQIKKHGLLAKILCNNYDINEIQPNVFKVPDNSDNRRVPCDQLPDIDWFKWKI